MKIIISIVAIMFYAVIGCFVSKKVYGEYDPLCMLFWPIMIACYIPIWIVSVILECFGWLSRKLRKRKSVYAHIDQNIENRWVSEEMLVKEWRHNSDDSPFDQLLKAKELILATGKNAKWLYPNLDKIRKEWVDMFRRKGVKLTEKQVDELCKIELLHPGTMYNWFNITSIVFTTEDPLYKFNDILSGTNMGGIKKKQHDGEGVNLKRVARKYGCFDEGGGDKDE